MVEMPIQYNGVGEHNTILGVRRGMEERKPDRMANRKVEREGEPKLRWV